MKRLFRRLTADLKSAGASLTGSSPVLGTISICKGFSRILRRTSIRSDASEIPRKHPLIAPECAQIAIAGLLLGINLGHWLPDLVSRRVARMVAAFGRGR